MMEVRLKDKIFLAFALPVAAIAAYFWLWRNDAAKKLSALEEKSSALVAKEDFEGEMARALARQAAAEKSLEEERMIKINANQVIASIDSSSAERESKVLNVFRSSGITVIRSEIADGMSEEAQLALENAGAARKSVCRKYLLDGTYPGIKKALDLFSLEKMAIIPERVEMRGTSVGRWVLYIWQ